MYCKNCGHEVEKNKKFCKNCGSSISAAIHELSVDSAQEIKLLKKLTKKQWQMIGGIMGGIVVLVFVLQFASRTDSNKNVGNQASVVDINCDTGYSGSGTIFTSDGTILTNNHVITGAKSCEVTIPDPTTGQISEIYEAVPIIVPKLSKKYDVATLRINGAYTDADGKMWGSYPMTFTPFTLPSSCNTSKPSQLGDSVRIYGYPITSGGYNLTVTDGVVSSFSDGGYILTSAKVDSGNSGGLAVDENGCWLGIPSAVESGNYQNLGVIIPGDIVAANFLSTVPAKSNPIDLKSSADATAAETAATPQPSNDQICQRTFGAYSNWSGQFGGNGNPTCTCKSGYSWDGSGNACASQASLNQSCIDSYGAGSYSSTQGGKAVCGCGSGYVWNSDQTACIIVPLKTGYQVCAEAGQNETWGGKYGADGSYQCVCDSGYSWDSSTQSCISGYTYCQKIDGYGATYDSATNSCACAPGYFFSGGQCVSGLTYCQNKEGYGATYNSSTNSCACQSGYVYNGNQCQSGYLYCSQRWGTGAEYDYSTGGCACGAGYYVNSAGTGCISAYSGY